MNKFQTSNFNVNLMQNSDWPFYNQLYNMPKLHQFTGLKLSQSDIEQGFRFAINCHKKSLPRQLVYIVKTKESAEQVGLIGLSSINYDKHEAEAGLILVPSAQGKGYPKELGVASLKHFFEKLKLNKVYIRFNPQNKPVLKALNQLGFQREGDGTASIFKSSLQIN